MRATMIALATVALGATACGRGPTASFGTPSVASVATSVGAAPMFAVSPDGAEAVAWVSAPGGGSDGSLYVSIAGAQPVVLTDPLGPIEPHGEAPPKLAYDGGGTLHALYVVGRVVPGRRFPVSALRAVHSRDAGRTWSAPVTVTDDSAEFGSHNFHALHAAADGAVYVAWLDGRQGRSAAWVARSTDGGSTWSTNVRVSPAEACPCCRTALTTAPDGTLYVAWRAVFTGSERDVVVARSTDHGATFSTPVRVHDDRWVYDGCPHAGPSLAADAQGRVHIAWWTGKEGGAGVWYARADDAGRTFSEPVAIDVAAHSRPSHAQLAVSPSGDTVAVTWDDGMVPMPVVRIRLSTDAGRTFGPASSLSDAGRAAGFPVIALRQGRLAVAWSEQGATEHEHAQHAMPNMKDPKAVMPLPTVGSARVMVRRGRLGAE